MSRRLYKCRGRRQERRELALLENASDPNTLSHGCFDDEFAKPKQDAHIEMQLQCQDRRATSPRREKSRWGHIPMFILEN
jgi:hypothetical protein